MPTGTAFFDADDEGAFAPRPAARSPWSADMLHGRLLAGLAARAVERAAPLDEFVPARLTVDLFKSPPMTPVRAELAPVRTGGRVRVVDVTMTCEGVGDVARATVLLLRLGDAPEGEVWSAPPWDVPPPDEVADSGMGGGPGGMELRPIGVPVFGVAARKRVWLRDSTPLVAGEPLTPFVRAAIASDFASPMSNSGVGGLAYINADITVQLGRLPAGEWLGFEVVDHVSERGASVSGCRLYDVDAPIGFVTVSAVRAR